MLSASRLVFAPIFAYVFLTGYGSRGITWIWVSIALVVIIQITDLFDGMVARARGEVTDFGKIFDPLADNLAFQTIFISFMIAGVIPLWMYLIFLYRESLMQLLRIICAASGIVLAARKSGKLKTVLQAIGVLGVLTISLFMSFKVSWMPTKIAGCHPGFWLMLIPMVFSMISMMDYIIPNWGQIKKMMTPKDVITTL
jgi:CDP-diacylglycerol--glycerol-3-phosphate 3-phosphatidyltransferase